MAERIALHVSMGVGPQQKDIKLGIGARQKQIAMEVVRGAKPLPFYEGPYITESQLYDSHMLDTEGFAMAHDVEVLAIQIHEVHNAAGGKTVTIGNA